MIAIRRRSAPGSAVMKPITIQVGSRLDVAELLRVDPLGADAHDDPGRQRDVQEALEGKARVRERIGGRPAAPACVEHEHRRQERADEEERPEHVR